MNFFDTKSKGIRSKNKSVRLSLPQAAAAKSLQLCPTLCNPADGSLPGSSVPGILQARTLEWIVATHSSILAWRNLWTEGPGGAMVHGVAESDRTE